MPAITGLSVPLRRMSPDGGHYFFGYYDVPAADAAGRHLCHKVPFRDHIPGPADEAVLGWIPLPGSVDEPAGELPFTPFAETTAWNFQQGSMLQWIPTLPDTCIYNSFENGRLGSCLHNVRTGERRCLPLPVMNVSADGRSALCGNMARQFAFRPGYGYAGAMDAGADVHAPEDDGVFLMDLMSGEYHLILSLSRIVDFLLKAGAPLEGRKVMINCMTFNPSGTRFILFLRNFPAASDPKWYTYIPTADRSGWQLHHHPVWGSASHYHWRDDETLVIWTKATEGRQPDLLLLDDRTGERQIIDRSFFLQDGHCSFSPDRRWLLYDSYPDAHSPDNFRNLQVYDLAARRGVDLGRFRSDPQRRDDDNRCDLHPRWLPGGRSISFDSVHEGVRGLYWADLRGVISATCHALFSLGQEAKPE